LAVSLQMTSVIDPVIGCRYFSPGPRLLSQPKRSPRWSVYYNVPKTSWAGLICSTHQHYHRRWLPKNGLLL